MRVKDEEIKEKIILTEKRKIELQEKLRQCNEGNAEYKRCLKLY
jgi:hypothetical protein